MDGPHIPGVAYTFGNVAGEEFGLLADLSVSVSGPHSTLSDVRVTVTNANSFDADILVNVTSRLAMSEDMAIIVTRSFVPINGSAATQVGNPALEFLGKGLKFPFTFQRRSGGAQISTATSSDHAHIHESIRQILGTKKGERFMRPDFGTRLHELVFEPSDQLLYGLIRHEVMEALDAWEPRIIVTEVSVSADESDEHLVLVNIIYKLISSQTESNCVFPFWRELE
jgi:phage baseplate assembly protein W